MGSSNFFSKIASIDPLAQALDLPGAHKYAQQQAQDEAGKAGASGGPYQGVQATLAGANAGYAPGGPGATVGWHQYVPHAQGGVFGALQGGANLVGNSMPYRGGNGAVPTAPGNLSTSNPYVQQNQTVNPYVTAARGAAAQNQWGG